MSERLTTYDFSRPSAITSSERMNYPWDDWFDGSIWRIEQGVDFKTHPLMMERIIRTRATARKAKIVLRHDPRSAEDPFGFIVFRRTDIDAPAQRSAAMVHPSSAGPPTGFTIVRPKRPVRAS